MPSQFIRSLQDHVPTPHPCLLCLLVPICSRGAADAPSCVASQSLRCSWGPTTVLAVIRQSWPPWPAAPILHSQPNRIALPPPPPVPGDPGDATLGPARAPAVPLCAASRSPPPSGSLRVAPRPPPARPAGFRYPDETQVVVGPLREPRHHVGRRSVSVRRRRGRGLRPPRHVPGLPRASGELLGRTAGGAALLGRSARIQAPRAVGAQRAYRQPGPRLPYKPPRSGLTAAMGSLVACGRAPH